MSWIILFMFGIYHQFDHHTLINKRKLPFLKCYVLKTLCQGHWPQVMLNIGTTPENKRPGVTNPDPASPRQNTLEKVTFFLTRVLIYDKLATDGTFSNITIQRFRCQIDYK